MKLPKFLIADNSDFPENIYIVHTERPQFILDVDTEEVNILDGSKPSSKEIEELKVLAFAFYERELDSYEEDEEYETYN